MKIIGGNFSTGNNDEIKLPSYADFVKAGGDSSAQGNATSVGAYDQYLQGQGIETSQLPGATLAMPIIPGGSDGSATASSAAGGSSTPIDIASTIGKILEYTPINMLGKIIGEINDGVGGKSGINANQPTNTQGLSFDDELFAEMYGIDPSYLGDLYSSDNYVPAQSGGGNDDSFIDQINDVGLINAIMNNMSAPVGDGVGNGGGGDGNGDGGGGGSAGGGQPEKDPLDPIYAPIGSGSEPSPTVVSPNVDGFFVRPSMLNTIPSNYDPRFAEANNRFLQAQAINPSYLNNVVDMRNFVPVEEQLTSG